MTGIFRPWPVRPSLTERDGNEDRKGTAIRQDQIRICRRQAVKCQDKSRVKQWRGGEGPRFSHVFHSLSREKGDGTKIDLQNRIGWKGNTANPIRKKRASSWLYGGENCERTHKIVYAANEPARDQTAQECCNDGKCLRCHLPGCSFLYSAHIPSFFKSNLRKMRGGF